MAHQPQPERRVNRVDARMESKAFLIVTIHEAAGRRHAILEAPNEASGEILARALAEAAADGVSARSYIPATPIPASDETTH